MLVPHSRFIFVANHKATNTTLSVASGTRGDAGLQLNSSNYEQIAKSAIQAINMVELNAERDSALSLLSELNASRWYVVSGQAGFPGLTLASQEQLTSEYGRADYAQTYRCDEVEFIHHATV